MPQQFGDFTASELYCPNCRRAQPVRERLLLVLPDGELFEFFCARCATSLAKRTVTAPPRSAATPWLSPGARSRPNPKGR